MKGTSIASFLLLALVVTWTVENRVEGQPKAPVKCKKLCTEFSSRKIPQKLLKTYRKTEPSCPKAAIIFVTQKNKEFCADPEASWVKEAVRQLNQASAPLNPPLSSTVNSAVVQEGAGVFHRLVGDAVSKPTPPSVPASPTHGAGTPVSQAIHVPVVRTEEPNIAILTVQEAKRSSTKSSSALQATVTPSTIHPEPVANGREVSIRSVTTPAADIPDSTSSRFHSDPTPVMKSSESFVGSRNKSTGSTISPPTDIPGTAPSRFHSDPTPVMKSSESFVGSRNKSTGSRISPPTDIPGTAPSRFHSDPTPVMKSSESFVGSRNKSTGSRISPPTDIPGTAPSRFHSDPTPVMKSSESFVGSRNKSTGSTISPPTDIPGTAPSRFHSDPTPVIKGFESPIRPTYNSVGSTRNQTADGLASAPSRLISDAPSIVNGPEIAELSPTFLTIPSPLESVPSKPVIGLTSMGQVTENSTMKPTAVLKGSDTTNQSTPHPTSPGGESTSVSPNSGDERDAVSDSTADAHTGSYLSPLGEKDPSRSFPESISPAETSVLSFKSSTLQNSAEGPSDGPLASSILPTSQTHILKLALLVSILGICSAAVWMYVKPKDCPEESAKELVQGLLFNQQRSRTNEYAMEAV
ncbi:mucin-5B [Chelonia mydas]|uniref:mucin-5B n=1 Tax=Chelonia mydas TaxID=8469 RepID=UPI0018A1BB64|nr:mucin-5B [Chelonia mydas]